jgi:hypothetical protein
MTKSLLSSAAPLFSALLFLASILHAEDQPAPDADLPQPFDASAADALLANSPFNRVVNLEEMLQLTGIAYVDGKPVATFFNKETQKHITVSEEPNALGWKITEASPGTHLQETEVHLLIGTEEVTMYYGDAQLTPGGSKKGVPSAFAARAGSSSNSRPPSNDGNYPKTSSFLGQNGREMYGSLSEGSRDKLKTAVREFVDKHPGLPTEKTSAYAQKIFSKLKAADQKAAPRKKN